MKSISIWKRLSETQSTSRAGLLSFFLQNQHRNDDDDQKSGLEICICVFASFFQLSIKHNLK